jgi:hypothetical protein
LAKPSPRSNSQVETAGPDVAIGSRMPAPIGDPVIRDSAFREGFDFAIMRLGCCFCSGGKRTHISPVVEDRL